MRNENHMINRQVFEFTCNSHEYAFSLQKEMDSGLQYKIRSVIGDLLDRANPHGVNTRIDKIEIDLGELPFEKLGEVLPGKIYAGLAGKLDTFFIPGTSIPSGQHNNIPALVEELEVFLLSGSLPWWGNRKEFSIDGTISALLKDNPGHLKALFLKHYFNPVFIQRLYLQVAPETIRCLVESFPFLQESKEFIKIVEQRFWEIIDTGKQDSVNESQHNSALDQNVDEENVEAGSVTVNSDMRQGFLAAGEKNGQIFNAGHRITELLQLLRKVSDNGPAISPEELERILIREMPEVFAVTDDRIKVVLHQVCVTFCESKKKVDIEKESLSSSHFDIINNKTVVKSNEKIYIQNAGLVLIATFLPLLFEELQFLKKGIFKNKEMQYKALFLLHYICTGFTSSPEYTLQLNKILCGIEIAEPIPAAVELTVTEQQEADQLLNDIIGHWTALKGGSIDAVRGSFLLRDALLFFKDGRWVVQADRKGYDILLDHVPWSWKTIKFDWMKSYIETEW